MRCWHALRRLRPRRALLAAILRPRAGRTLPDELRAENVERLAEALPQGVRGAEFQRLVGRIETGTIHHGNQVQLFFHGEEAFASVRKAIEGATQEILLETYILKDDAIGRKLLGLLGSAAARGVKVKVLAALVAASRERLWITNAYFAPNRIAIELLGHAAQRGVDVRLLLPGRSDMPLVRHAGHGNFSALLASGVRIFEYQAAILHAKMLVVGDYVSVVGSSNLDFRSFYFNAECNVLILDDETGRTMAQAFEHDLARSIEVQPATWRQRSVAHRWGDALARCFSPML